MQDRVKKVLAGIATHQRIANGYLFIGPPGCGKTEAALWFFQYLMCTALEKPCGACEHCQRIVSGKPVDLYRIKPETTVKIDQIRDLKQHVQYGPREFPYLMAIVENAERFTTDAANSFLKVLEEPPQNVFFILETSQQDAVLKTILSRCQKIQFDAPLGALALSEEVALIKQFALDIKGKLFNDMVTFVDKSCKVKDDCIAALDGLLQEFHQRQDVARANLIKGYLKILQKNVNLKLTMEVILMKLRGMA